MDLQMETSVEGGILFATFTGRAKLDTLVRDVKRACDIAAEQKIEKILINVLEMSGPLSAFDRYAVGSQVTEHLVHLGINPKVALVGVPPTTDGFAIRVAQNRGAMAEVFQSIEKALDWLGRPPSAG